MEGDQPMDSQAPTITENPSSGAPAEHIGSGTVTDSGGEHDGSNYAEGNMHGQDGAQAVAYESNTEVVVVGADDVGVNHENSGVIDASIGYDSMNGNAGQLGIYQGSAATENGILSNEVMTSAAQQHAEDVNSAEEHRLWGMVHANCLDFNAWTALIEETEKVAENNILKIRKVYDAFLAEFPLCFGYWKKYADHEARLGSVEKVFEVYERAVHSVTYSVDIWLYYCMFAISTYEDPDTIRRLFERGLAFVGSDYLSYPLWDEYIRYEEAHQAWINLAMIYTRILENPIQQLDRYFNCFKELAASRPLSEIRTEEESELMARTIHAPASYLEEQVRSDAVEQSSESANAGLTEAEELVKYVTVREELYKKAKDFESKIIEFETAIRRPYFHVRPLDDPELENWHNYLDFIEKVDDINKVIKLYERCLIACANYPEFWIRYVLSMELSGNMELAYNALARASHVFVKKHPEIHLFAAKFKEMCEDFAGARSEYQFIYSEISPCLLEAIIKHANMEYRLGNKEVAYSIYEEVIAAEKDRERSQILPMLLVQYSRFLYLVASDLEKARELLFGSLDQAQVSKPLLEAVIHLETIQPHSKRIDYLDTLVEKFISPDSDNTDVASTTDREEISCIFMEFLDLFGDAQSIRKAYNRHMKLFLHQKRKSVSKKRQAEDFLASDNTKLARPSADGTSSSQQVVGAYPNAQNQWTAGYGQRAPWPQNSQAQGHQWNPGYTSQPPFIAYGYANYTPPQVPVPASAPQTAAYPYTPTHPVQAYPQQSYTQPSVAGATFPQQQGAAQQPYYGSYY